MKKREECEGVALPNSFLNKNELGLPQRSEARSSPTLCLTKGHALIIFFIFFHLVNAQIVIHKFIPGDFRFSNTHRVELLNIGNEPKNIGDFLIVTRDYSVKLPSKIVLFPNQKYIIAQKNSVLKPDLDLTSCKDFLFKPYKKNVEGNYVVLFSNYLQFIDGFYFSQLKDVPFLPEKNRLILGNGNIIHYEIPESHFPKWKFYPIGEDPAIGFEQYLGEWRLTSVYPHKKIYSQVQFKNFGYRFLNNVINFYLETSTEENLSHFELQKLNGNQFYTIYKLEPCNSYKGGIYKFADADVKPNQTLYYRIASYDQFGLWSYSKVIEVETQENQKDFWYEILPQKPNPQQEISLRFLSSFSQPLKVKLLNEKMQELSIIFNSFIYANQQNLLRIKKLPTGKYWLVFQNDFQRKFYSFTVD